MRKIPLTACLWPGFARLWYAGKWSGLAAALLFAVLLNLALVATFLRPERFGFGLQAALWSVVVGMWLLSAWRTSRKSAHPLAGEPAGPQVDLFIQAQAEYLKGSWFEAESRLKELLAINDLDVDAHMMLAGLYRHTNRFAEAHQCLRRLERMAGAEKWRLEIEDERTRLEHKQQRRSDNPQTGPPPADVAEAA